MDSKRAISKRAGRSSPSEYASATNCISWILQNKLVNENNSPIEFKDHTFLIDPYLDNTPKQAICKAAQIGWSTLAILRAFHLAKYAKANIIHTFPSQSMSKDFVVPKVNPLIANNKVLKNMMGVDTASLKQVDDRYIYYRGCVSEDTEILTVNGWKKWKEVKVGEKMPTVNQESEEIELKPIRKIFVYDVDEELIHIHNRSIDKLVTADHNCLVRKQHKGKLQIVKAKNIKGFSNWRIPIASNPLNSWKGIDENDAFCKVLGWVIGDGSYWRRKHPKRISTMVSITQKEKCEELEEDLTLAGIPFSVYRDLEGIGHYKLRVKESKQIVKYIPNKTLPLDLVFKMNLRQKYCLFDGLMASDGHKDGTKFTQVKLETVESFRILCLMFGRNTGIYKRTQIGFGKLATDYIINFKTSRNCFKFNVDRVPYKGKVWCVENKNNSLFARRNGKVYITGNSFEQTEAISISAHILIQDEFDRCFPGNSVEVLTKSGWKLIEKIKKNDYILTRNLKNHISSFKKPTRLIKRDYDGKLYTLKARGINIPVTKNHRLLVQFTGKKQELKIIKDIYNKPFTVLNKVRWHNDYRKVASIPRIDTKRNQRFKREVAPLIFPAKKVNAYAWFEFLGWYLAEGSIGKYKAKFGKYKAKFGKYKAKFGKYKAKFGKYKAKYGKRANGQIVITQKNKENIKIIVDCIQRLGFKPKLYCYGNSATQISFSDLHLALYLQKLGTVYQKYIPKRWLWSHTSLCKEMLKSLMLGDGDKRGVYTTVSKRLANDVQILMLRVGKSANIYKSEHKYKVGLIKTPYRRFNGKRGSNTKAIVERTHYKGKVFCLSIPNQTMLVRQKGGGLPIWSGNSNQNVLKTYRSRLDDVKRERPELGWEWQFSNPSIPGAGVDVWYQRSDQKHWFVKCRKCHKQQYMNFPDNICFERKLKVCSKCKAPITADDLRKGRWVYKYKDRQISGYWISQMMIPWITADKIIEDSMGDQDIFHNFVLGLPYVSKDTALTRETIIGCLSPGYNPRTNVAIGVDNGKEKTYVIGNKYGIFEMGVTDDWAEIERLRNRYNAIMVIDSLPYPHTPRKLAEQYPGKVFVHYYREDTKRAGIIRWDGEVVKSDRTKIIDSVVADFNAKDITINMTERQIEDFITHWKQMYRMIKLTPQGIKKPIWQTIEGRADHLAHCLSGNTKVETSIGEKEIKDIKKDDFVLTSDGFKKVIDCGMTHKEAIVAEVVFSNGKTIIATPTHKFKTQRGFIELHNIRKDDILESICKSRRYLEIPKSLMEKFIGDIKEKDIFNQSLLYQNEKEYIELFGFSLMEKLKRVFISIIKTGIYSITILKIFLLFLQKNIQSIILKHLLRLNVLCVGNHINPETQVETNTVLLNAVPIYITENTVKLKGNVSFAEKSLQQIPILEGKLVVKPVRIKRYRLLKKQIPVYDLSVDTKHEYYANGILVSNSTIYWRIALEQTLGLGTIASPNSPSKLGYHPTANPDKTVPALDLEAVGKKTGKTKKSWKTI